MDELLNNSSGWHQGLFVWLPIAVKVFDAVSFAHATSYWSYTTVTTHTDAVSPPIEKDHHKTLHLRVRYISARKPFEDPHASVNEKLAALKPRVLAFFNLSEVTTDGGTKTYSFSLNGVGVTDMSVTLGALAQGKHDLKLDLIERFDQG